MGQADVHLWGFLPPSEAPSLQDHRDDNWRHFDKSVNAISFGFVATAILISMFLVMAIFERFLMTTSSPLSPSAGGGGRSSTGDVESQTGLNSKHGHPSPKISRSAREVSVLMPGEDVPTFIAQPAPVSCQQERVSSLVDRHISYPKLASNTFSQGH